jgi:exopolysaccharide biosynthesis WecB/TagA/CpsF family protein
MENRINLIDLVRERIEGMKDCHRRGQSTIFLNPYSYLLLRTQPHLLKNVGRVGIDGQLLVKILSLLWRKKIDRVSFDMTSFAPVVFEHAQRFQERVYIIGSTSENVQRAIDVLCNFYPKLIVCGSRNGYFSDDDDRVSTFLEIIDSKADVLICGMGTPHQERFLCDLFRLGWRGASYTCGGFLHQTATRGVAYYPAWVNKYHLRWAYRILDEPKLVKRYFFQYPLAIFFVVKDCVKAAFHR